jgi:transglutaminase-like putative cysteine protease
MHLANRSWVYGCLVVLGACLILIPGRAEEAPRKAEPKSRTFEFTYTARVLGLKPGQTARVWIPVPSSSEDQDVRVIEKQAPGGVQINRELRYGNQIGYVEAKAEEGQVSLKMVYRVTRREVLGRTGGKGEEDRERLARYLRPDTLVPVTGKPLELIKGQELPEDPMKKARVLYDTVNGHMRYSKEGTGWGRGDSVWACDSRFGNCSDFHSLFISLARSQKIPARFEIGFPLPEKRGAGEIPGYHCWAFFQPEDGKGWVPVDISEANKDPKRKEYFFGNLTEDRVTFNSGRDLELVPRQMGGPRNFLIYPYVEVDGKEYPESRVEKKFGFRDLR